MQPDRHFPANEFESLDNITLGFSLILFDQDRSHELEHDIVRRQGGELLVGWSSPLALEE
jgi:hypothetical protein